MDPAGSFNKEIWLEQHVGAMETFSADSDDVSVWENVGLLLVDFHVRFELGNPNHCSSFFQWQP